MVRCHYGEEGSSIFGCRNSLRHSICCRASSMENGEDWNGSQAPASAGDDERPSFKTREQVYDRIGAQADPVGEAPGQGVEAPERGSANGADALDAERETEAAVDLHKYGAKRPTANSDGDGKAKPVYPKPRPSSKVCILSIDGGKGASGSAQPMLRAYHQLCPPLCGDLPPQSVCIASHAPGLPCAWPVCCWPDASGRGLSAPGMHNMGLCVRMSRRCAWCDPEQDPDAAGAAAGREERRP